MIFFYKESKSNKKKKKKRKKENLAAGRGWVGGEASVSDLFFFFQKNPSLKKKLFPFLRV